MLRHPIWRPADAGAGSSTLGIAASALVHLAVIGVCVLYTREPGHYAEGGSTELVRFLVPPQRVPRHQFETERVEFMRIGIPDGWGVSDIDGERTGSELAAAPRRGEVGHDPEFDRPRARDLDELLADDNVFSALEVDSGVVRSPESAAPFYPAELLALNVEGFVRTRYVVDSGGRVDTATFQIIEASHPAFAYAVLTAAPRMRFRPAIAGGRKVAQLVEQTFEFRVARKQDKVSLRTPPRGRTLAPVNADDALTDHAT
jgi:TonB family protein